MPALFKDLDWVNIGAGLLRAKLVDPDGKRWRAFVSGPRFLLRSDDSSVHLYEYDNPLDLMCAIHHHNLTPVGNPHENRNDRLRR